MIITAGIHKGRKIQVPDENITRPTLSKAREAIFSVLFSLTGFEGKFFLDVFAGSGIMGLEAISRGFLGAVAIEKSPKVARILSENYKNLDITPNLLIGDARRLIPRITRKFDVIYLDPPYESGIYEETLEKIKNSEVLSENSIIILEHTAKINWGTLGYKLIKQKEYSKKLITFLEPST